jgi:hypothetical protein
MSVPPPDHDRQRDPDERAVARPDQPLDFDPYRFGRPDHPIPPEYAPPGYVPPAPTPVQAPPPFPYGYPPPPPAYPYGVTRTTNTKATLALVFGILGIVFFFLTVLDLALIVPAIVLGILGRNDAVRFPERGGRRNATIGLICGIVAGVLVVAGTVFAYQRIKPCVDRYSISSSAYQQCVQDRLLGSA